MSGRAGAALACALTVGLALGARPRYWPTAVALEVREPSSDPYQLFYDRGAGYGEDDSVTASVTTDAREPFSRVTLSLPPARIERIRIDPPAEGWPLHIRELCLVNAALRWRRECWSADELLRDFRPLHDIDRFVLAGRELELHETGLDAAFDSSAGTFGAPFEDVGRVRPAEALAIVILLSLLVFAALGLTRTALACAARALAWLAVTFLLPAVLVEGLMIVAEPWLFRGPFEYDAELGFRVRAGYGGANRFGFNARELPLAKPAGTYRILVVGDSFGWTGGIEGNYTGLIEKRFDRYFGRHRVDVISAGYSMTHTVEQLAVLRKYGLQYQPDLVLLGFFAGNDFYDGDAHRKRVVLGNVYADIDTRHPPLLLFGRLLIPQSRLFLLLRQQWKVLEGVERTEGANLTFTEPAFIEAERAHILFYDRRLHEAGRFRDNVAFIVGGVSDMRRVAEAHHARFAVAVIPAEFSVDEAVAEQILATLPVDRSEFDLALAQQILDGHLRNEGIPYVDLLGPFREAGRSRRLYIPRDGHWTFAGNQLAAEVLFPFLLERVRVDTGWE